MPAGLEAKRLGTGHPSIVPYQAFATRNGHMALMAGNDGQFRSLCRMLRRPDLETDPRFASNPLRVTNRKARIALAAAQRPPAHSPALTVGDGEQVLTKELEAVFRQRTTEV